MDDYAKHAAEWFERGEHDIEADLKEKLKG